MGRDWGHCSQVGRGLGTIYFMKFLKCRGDLGLGEQIF